MISGPVRFLSVDNLAILWITVHAWGIDKHCVTLHIFADKTACELYKP